MNDLYGAAVKTMIPGGGWKVALAQVDEDDNGKITVQVLEVPVIAFATIRAKMWDVDEVVPVIQCPDGGVTSGFLTFNLEDWVTTLIPPGEMLYPFQKSQLERDAIDTYKMRSEEIAREKQAYQARLKGESFESIAKRFQLTKTRAKEIALLADKEARQ